MAPLITTLSDAVYFLKFEEKYSKASKVFEKNEESAKHMILL